MFQFRRFPTYTYLIQCMLTDFYSAGLPHSEIHGSMPAFGSPWLIVDRYVLRRLPVPRHSPCALCSLTFASILWFFHSTIIISCSFYPSKNFLPFSHLLSSLFSFQGALKRAHLLVLWWAQVDSNHRPHAYQACALTT